MGSTRRKRNAVAFGIVFFAAQMWCAGWAESLPDTAATAGDTVVVQLNEVVVTGTRYEKKIIDIPYSVSRVENTHFQFARKTGVDDVLGEVPGLFLQSRYGNHDVRVSIRGFGSRSNSGIRGVRILLDGIPESEPDGQTRIEAIDFNSIGRIEIVKGNASSLYTNAPGGVINFINDTYFPRTFAVQFNDFGAFDLRRNGFKTGIRTDEYAYLLTYSYHNYGGYRAHSEDYWHILNTVLETTPTANTHLQILGYYVNGQIRLPGSLTREEYLEDPFQAAQREVDFDFRRLSKKGRLGLRFTAAFDRAGRNELEVTAYGTIKYFERPSRTFRIINRNGLGASWRFVNRRQIAGRKNEFSVGGDMLNQTGPIEFYQNINGLRSDILTGLNNETIANVGFFFQNALEVLPRRLTLFITGRYDKVVFDQKNQLLAAQNDRRRFEAFTPKVALNYKLSPALALYGSAGRSFESPAGNELDNYPLSSNPGKLINPDLQAQESRFVELGIKGSVVRPQSPFLRHIQFDLTAFKYMIDNEIVPFEVFSEVFFRNSARTERTGMEMGLEAEGLRGLQLHLAYTFSHFVYDQYRARTIEIGNDGSLITRDRDFSGNIVPSVPRHNLSLALTHTRQPLAYLKWFGKIHLLKISGLYVDDANREQTEGYALWNATVGAQLLRGRFHLMASGGIKNLFDQRHVAFVNINSAAGRFYESGAPRNYFGTLRFGLSF